MLAVVSAYLKHNQKNYYFTDSVLCNINSKKEGYKYAEELECTLHAFCRIICQQDFHPQSD